MFTQNLGISTLDYGAFHGYSEQWGYPHNWGSTWVSEHAALAEQYNKPIVLEEYVSLNTQSNESAIDQLWQSTVLNSNIAYDRFWQFGTKLPSGTNDSDVCALYYGTSIYKILAIDHAQAMADRTVLRTPYGTSTHEWTSSQH